MKEKNEAKQIGLPGVMAIMLASSLTVMVGNAITPALPELGEVYGLGNYASWLVTAPALGVTATALLFGKLIDGFSRSSVLWRVRCSGSFYAKCSCDFHRQIFLRSCHCRDYECGCSAYYRVFRRRETA